MAEKWYESAYKGGGPVQAEFARPLYPPDAAQYGKKPSSDGPDVIALKRALCRGGRWGEWNPASWDDSFSNAFAHGKAGGNVKDSGVAGFQRQQHLDATGWVGQKTFTNMRYALISDPKSPHYGEPLFDSVCVELLEQAWELYAGHEPVEETGTVRQAALSLAKTQLGVSESPSGSNVVLYSNWYGMTGPWCMMFISWLFEMNPLGPSPSFARGSAYSYVPYFLGDARAARNGLVTTDTPVPGDAVTYDWETDSCPDHVGLFDQWTSGQEFAAIEGNTSPDDYGSQSNGGMVCRKIRSVGPGVVFVRIAEP